MSLRMIVTYFVTHLLLHPFLLPLTVSHILPLFLQPQILRQSVMRYNFGIHSQSKRRERSHAKCLVLSTIRSLSDCSSASSPSPPVGEEPVMQPRVPRHCALLLMILCVSLCDARRTGGRSDSRRRYDVCKGDECHGGGQSEEDAGQDEESFHSSGRGRRPGTGMRYHPSSSLSSSSHHLHRQEAAAHPPFASYRTKGRRFSTRYFDLDEESIDDPSGESDRREMSDERDDDSHHRHRYHDEDDDDPHFPRRSSSKIVDLPRTYPKKSFSAPDDIPIPPLVPSSFDSFPPYDHRSPRSLEFDDGHDSIPEDYPDVRRGQNRRYSSYDSESSDRGKGWSRSYWKKYPSNYESSSSSQQHSSRPSAHMMPSSSSDEVLDPANGLDGFLPAIYGNSMSSSSRSSSSRNKFPLTMDQLPLLDPHPALDKTLMESFLTTNQRLASLLASESFSPNFNDASDQVPTSASPDSSRSSSGGGRDPANGSGISSFKSLIPFGLSLSGLFGNSRSSSKGTAGQEANDEDNDDDEAAENSRSDSCDSNDSSDSRNSYKIVDPPSLPTVPTTVSLLTSTFASGVASSQRSVTSTPDSASTTTTTTTSEGLKGRAKSGVVVRKRIGFVRSTAM